MKLIKEIIIYRKAGQDIISPVASARIVTSDSFSFTYGVVEIRAKMPKGDWLAPGTIRLITNSFLFYLLELFSLRNLAVTY